MTSGIRSLDRAVILHGYTAGPHSHWFDWMVDELARDGVSTVVPTMPDSSNPQPAAWVAAAREAMGTPDAGLLVVGHSLGVITALHAFDATEGEWELGAFVGVAGAARPVAQLPSLDPFHRVEPDFERTRSRMTRSLSVRSDDDEIVSPELTAALGRRLGSAELVVPGGGHFLGVQGWRTFPALLSWIRDTPAE